ncbi:hypothetical protein DAPPUDRAFT_332513 [Daphnia pulex]|uniref:Uncharacterized protein n=1 Tax=Daphnia pulex TaxID=6669 RepID=E9HQ61_DAPPU|nr:hypothetical protein DAPPUDRAFT_332513 [Daphnia pulex]|eukprot:EFX66113.1 hypothetical protein DAPPUDRAFT_332513 [Daphnia pulex]
MAEHALTSKLHPCELSAKKMSSFEKNFILLRKSCMVDFAMDVLKKLYPDQEIPPTLKDKLTKRPVKVSVSKGSRYLLGYLTKNFSQEPEMLELLFASNAGNGME